MCLVRLASRSDNLTHLIGLLNDYSILRLFAVRLPPASKQTISTHSAAWFTADAAYDEGIYSELPDTPLVCIF
jgi:hypothetical protein